MLIRMEQGNAPRIISRDNPQWRPLGEQDEQYRRAIHLGEGCWERLESVSEETAERILREWGLNA